ncbi:MAG: RNase H family protein [Blastocatellia bacterium]
MDNTKLKEVEIFISGITKRNPGQTAFAILLLHQLNGKQHQKEIKGSLRLSTNSRTQLIATTTALSLLKESCQVKLYTDAQYITNPFNLGWLARWENDDWRDVKNLDLWKQLLKLCQVHKVEFIWLKQHSGNPNQERAEYLASLALKDKEPVIDFVYEQKLAQENLLDKLSA